MTDFAALSKTTLYGPLGVGQALVFDTEGQQPATVTLAPTREFFIPLPSDPAARLRSLQALRAACEMRPDMGKMDPETLARIAELEAQASLPDAGTGGPC